MNLEQHPGFLAALHEIYRIEEERLARALKPGVLRPLDNPSGRPRHTLEILQAEEESI